MLVSYICIQKIGAMFTSLPQCVKSENYKPQRKNSDLHVPLFPACDAGSHKEVKGTEEKGNALNCSRDSSSSTSVTSNV